MAKKRNSARAEEIKRLMETLPGLSQEDAANLAAFDAGEIENETVNEIEAKVAEGKTEKRSPLEKVRHSRAKKKVDQEKSAIVKSIFDFVREALPGVVAPQEITSTKLTFKSLSGEYYSITVTKHKHKPDGYRG